MSLTDDWKVSNDFKSGKYFCRLNNIKKNKIVTIELSKFGHFNGIIGNYIEEVLIPCDYGYISELESKNKHLLALQANQDDEIERLRDENEKLGLDNNQLRLLLKDSIYILNEYKHCFDVKHHNIAANIIDKASEVLK